MEQVDPENGKVLEPLVPVYEKISLRQGRCRFCFLHKTNIEKTERYTLKVLFFIGEFPKLSETFILNQITGMISSGHEVTIFADHKENNSKVHEDVSKYHLMSKVHYYGFDGNKIQRRVFLLERLIRWFPKILFGKNSLSNIRHILKFPMLISFYHQLQVNKIGSFDVILAHFGPNGVRAQELIDLGWLKGRLFTVFHGYDMIKYLKTNGMDAYNKLFASESVLLPISEFWKNSLIRLGADPHRTIVHHMGIDLEKFEFSPQIYDQEITILSVARFVEKKGLAYGLLAVSQLIKKGYKVRYIIIGNGPLKADLKKVIAENNLDEHVKLLGWKTQKEIAELMKAMQIVLLPSVTSRYGDMEGIPVFLMEAMAMGKIVVSTYHSGIPELIDNQKNGYLVQEKDIDGLVGVLEYIVRSKDKWTEIADNARTKVDSEFNIHKLNDRLVEIFQNELKNHDEDLKEHKLPL